MSAAHVTLFCNFYLWNSHVRNLSNFQAGWLYIRQLNVSVLAFGQASTLIFLITFSKFYVCLNCLGSIRAEDVGESKCNVK